MDYASVIRGSTSMDYGSKIRAVRGVRSMDFRDSNQGSKSMDYGSVVGGSTSMDYGSVLRGVRSMDFRDSNQESQIHGLWQRFKGCQIHGFRMI